MSFRSLVCMLFFSISMSNTVANTFIVNSDLDDFSMGTFRSALFQATFVSSGLDTIRCLGADTIVLSDPLYAIEDSLVILANGWTIDGNNTWPGLQINAYTEIYDLVIINGYRVGSGGGFLVNEDEDEVRLVNCRIEGCQASFNGGGVSQSNSDGDLILENCTLKDNTANSTLVTIGGGGLSSNNSGFLLLQGCTFIGNSAIIGNAIQTILTDVNFSGTTVFGPGQDIDGLQDTEEYYLEPTFCIQLGDEFEVGH